MTSLYPFIQDSLEWPFSELTFSDVWLWNQYKYIAFNIFSCRTLIISYKMLIITGISSEKTNELTIHAILYQKVTIFCRQEQVLYIKCTKNWKRTRDSKWNFSSGCFIPDDNHVKIVRLHRIVFTKHDVLHFWDNVILSISNPVKVSQNCFSSFCCSSETSRQVYIFFKFVLD